MKYKKVLPHVFFAILVGVFVLLNNSTLLNNKASHPSISNNEITDKTNVIAKVIRVVDGDTTEVSLNGKKETVRLIGIDAPETVDLRESVQCFGKKASNKAKELLYGKTITLESDLTQGNRDKYQRLLRYAILEDGTNFSKLMISEGFAHEYTYQSNPYKYMEEFKNAEKQAREGKVGLWSDVIKCNYE